MWIIDREIMEQEILLLNVLVPIFHINFNWMESIYEYSKMAQFLVMYTLNPVVSLKFHESVYCEFYIRGA